MTTFLKITAVQAQALLDARKQGGYNRKNIKKRVFAEIHATHGIPRNVKIKMFIENPDHDQYLVIRNKKTGVPFQSNIPDAVLSVGTSPAKAVPVAAKAVAVTAKPAVKKAVAVTKKAAVKAPAKKAVAVTAKKAPAKKAVAVTAKVVAKKTVHKAVGVVKAPAKKAVLSPATKKAMAALAKAVPVKAPAKKVVAKKAVFSATKTPSTPIEIRCTIDGQRKRLGWASDEAMKAKVIAKAKAGV